MNTRLGRVQPPDQHTSEMAFRLGLILCSEIVSRAEMFNRSVLALDG